jgi:hypothetical protein
VCSGGVQKLLPLLVIAPYRLPFSEGGLPLRSPAYLAVSLAKHFMIFIPRHDDLADRKGVGVLQVLAMKFLGHQNSPLRGRHSPPM